jgi:hypothetical protein
VAASNVDRLRKIPLSISVSLPSRILCADLSTVR